MLLLLLTSFLHKVPGCETEFLKIHSMFGCKNNMVKIFNIKKTFL